MATKKLLSSLVFTQIPKINKPPSDRPTSPKAQVDINPAVQLNFSHSASNSPQTLHKALTPKRAKRPKPKRPEIIPLTSAQQNVCCAQGHSGRQQPHKARPRLQYARWRVVSLSGWSWAALHLLIVRIVALQDAKDVQRAPIPSPAPALAATFTAFWREAERSNRHWWLLWSPWWQQGWGFGDVFRMILWLGLLSSLVF